MALQPSNGPIGPPSLVVRDICEELLLFCCIAKFETIVDYSGL